MNITLDPQTEQHLAEQAAREGFASPDALVTYLIRQHYDRSVSTTRSGQSMTKEELMTTDAWKAVQRIAGTWQSPLTTDDVMRMTRGDDWGQP